MTAPPVDYMADHENTSQLVRDALFPCSVPNYVTKQWEPAPPIDRIPHFYYVDRSPAATPRGATPCPASTWT
jgi:hypothetical protein